MSLYSFPLIRNSCSTVARKPFVSASWQLARLTSLQQSIILWLWIDLSDFTQYRAAYLAFILHCNYWERTHYLTSMTLCWLCWCVLIRLCIHEFLSCYKNWYLPLWCFRATLIVCAMRDLIKTAVDSWPSQCCVQGQSLAMYSVKASLKLHNKSVLQLIIIYLQNTILFASTTLLTS